VSDRDPLELAQERLTALEHLFDDWRAATDPDDAHREAWEHIDAEIAKARAAIVEAGAQHKKELEVLEEQHTAELDLATHSSRAHRDIVAARAAVSLETARAEADEALKEREAERESLLVEVEELREEVATLSSFSVERVLALYTARAEADEAEVAKVRKECNAARKRVTKAEAEGRRSGARTALEMAQMDLSLEMARAERDRAEQALATAESRLASAREKLAAWRARA
jgi:hypothetical protein